jgi:hypothetical protein
MSLAQPSRTIVVEPLEVSAPAPPPAEAPAREERVETPAPPPAAPARP